MSSESANSSAELAVSAMALKQPLTNSKQCSLTSWINGPPQSTATTGPTTHYVKETSETSKPKTSPTLTSCAEASPVNPSQWHLANAKDSKTHAAHSFMKSFGLQKQNNPKCFFSKTSPAYLASNKEKSFKPSLKKWGNWGIYANGRFLTANFSESLNPADECSLSHILQSETEVGEQFFLSHKAMTTIVRKIVWGGKSFRPRLLQALEQHAILEATP